jgi:hypothetical protein
VFNIIDCQAEYVNSLEVEQKLMSISLFLRNHEAGAIRYTWSLITNISDEQALIYSIGCLSAIHQAYRVGCAERCN